MSEKQVLLTINNVRIKEYDSMNVVVERQEEVFVPTKKQMELKWKFKGYTNSVLSALKMIVREELLINRKDIDAIESYVSQVEQLNAAILEVMNE